MPLQAATSPETDEQWAAIEEVELGEGSSLLVTGSRRSALIRSLVVGNSAHLAWLNSTIRLYIKNVIEAKLTQCNLQA